MNTESLHVILQQSFSPDAKLRDPAEKTIKNLKHVKSATIMLLQVAAEKQVQFEVRQAAAIHLKNLCREHWVERVSISQVPSSPVSSENDKEYYISDGDKDDLRLNIVEALLSEHEKSVRDLMAETVYSIATHDYPDKWPNLLPTLLQTISQASDHLRVHNALLALRKICKRYEYKSREQRGPLNQIVTQSFPLLLPLAQRLCDSNEHSLEAALMLKQILKIFWSSTQFYLPGDGSGNSVTLGNPQAMQPWFEILQVALVKPLPEACTGQPPLNQPTDVEERNAWPWWRVKKWSVQIMSRLFSRYGIPSYAEDEFKDFAAYFSQHVAINFLGPVCETLNLRPSGQFCTDRVVHLCLSFVDLAVELAPTYKVLKPHLDFLLYKVCFPTMCLTPADTDLFENDPHEFIHRQNSPMADFYDPRMSAITLVTDLVKHRGQDVTQALLSFLTENLQRYNAVDDASKNHLEKEGSLLTIGSLSEYLLSKKKFAQELEGMLVTHVFPDFVSPIGYLRCRACWMVQRFSTVTWSDDGSRLKNLIELVLQRLSDPALPVQIEASKALRYLIGTEGAETVLLPFLPQILNEYFRIMNEIGNDEVVSALQAIIDQFGDHIEPHALALITQLSNAFITYSNAADDDDDAAMAAAQCLECISAVLRGICERPDLYKTLEPQLLPLIIKILGNDGEYIEYLEHALDILTFLTYFPDEISLEVWQTFPLIYSAFDQWAYDYLNLMVPPLENFIGKSPQQFITGSSQGNEKYIDYVFSIVSKTITEERATESDIRKALSLYTSVLNNCTGMVDAYLPIINDIVLAKLGQQVNQDVPLTRIAIFQVIASALYYNPQLQLAELEKRGVTQQVFTQWIKDSESMERWLAKKLTVLGLSSILRLPVNSLPPVVSGSIPQLLTCVVTIAMKMNEEEETAPKDNDADIKEDEDIDEDFEGFGEDEDVTNAGDEAYIDALKKLGTSGDMAQFLIGDDWMDDDDDDDYYVSPLDDIDQTIFFSETLNAAFQREPEAYQQIQAALPSDIVSSCQHLFTAAESQRS
eukprot:CAMPEP_0184857384 /NCGR_PEP_ID=MMETSP0580-20130426/2545_1 /TAXON_ID=1118495 /ORGANISM="Dactyliosolen fragilissimus" /LENGTH=1039 /DNA_ID=CAMNT_0027352953 /DNA_START=55 /DNA_END=3174 /DNA_ORIENTATION=+